MSKETKPTLEQICTALNKGAGAGTITSLDRTTDIEAIPSGILSLDLALGIGGYPRGRIIEMYGPESGGKSTLALLAVANAQRMGIKCLYVDVECALDKVYASSLGVDSGSLMVMQPTCGEEALENLDKIVQTGEIGLAVVDSVAALTPRAELEGEIGDSFMGLQARMMSQALRKLPTEAYKSNTAIIFINQIRMKLGIMFGNPETTPGGNALKFYASVRMDVRKGSSLKSGDKIIGYETKVKIIKNKVAPPLLTSKFDMFSGKGPSIIGDIFDMAVEHEVVEKAGAWYKFKEEKWQGRNGAKVFLLNNPETLEELRQGVLDKVRGTT